MIAHEHVQKIRFKDLLFVFIAVLVVSLIIFTTNLLFSPTTSFIVSLIFLVLGMNISVYLIKKSGAATLFYILTAIMTFWIDDVGIIGWKKILVFFFAGLIFEFIFLFLKLHLHNVPLDMVMGTGLSVSSIPLIMAFMISDELAGSFPLQLLNIIILAFAVGIIASTIVFLFWHEIEHTRLILWLESYLMTLA